MGAGGVDGVGGPRTGEVEQVARLQRELQTARSTASRLETELDAELKELTQARERYFELYDLAPIGYCTLNSRGIIMQANLAASEMARVARGSLVLQPMSRIVHPDDLDLAREMLAAVVGGESVEGFDLRLRRPDGSVLWAHVRASFRPDPSGGTALVAWADITERREAALALAASEERFRSLYDNSQSGIALHEVILDAQGEAADFRHATVNRAFEAQTGIRAEDAIGRLLTEVSPGGTAAALLAAFRRVWRGGAPEDLRVYWEPTGRHLHVSVYAAGAGRIAAAKTDITALIEAEHAARSAHERTLLSLRAVRAGTWEHDLATGQSSWSEEVWQLLGLSPQGCVPSEDTWLETVHPDDRRRVQTEMRRVVDGGLEGTVEWRSDPALGPIRRLIMRGGPERNSRGEIAAYVGILVDLTDRRTRREG